MATSYGIKHIVRQRKANLVVSGSTSDAASATGATDGCAGFGWRFNWNSRINWNSRWNLGWASSFVNLHRVTQLIRKVNI